uniref:Uncharacterized protein n=1 Tax=Globodera pallida TaxID=36090 RepID=A0A183CHN9_GLOPA
MSESDSSGKKLGAKDNTSTADDNTSKQSTSADSEEKRLQNEILVNCVCIDDYLVPVPFALLPQCKI